LFGGGSSHDDKPQEACQWQHASWAGRIHNESLGIFFMVRLIKCALPAAKLGKHASWAGRTIDPQ
jgi:hypothetical protein